MIPFIEKVLGDYLRGRSDVSAITGTRVATKTPPTLDDPWIRITLLDDPPVGKSTADHLIAFYADIECFAGRKGSRSEANLLARTVRAALGEIKDGEYTETVISGARVEGSRPRPDTIFEPTMDRYIVTATIWAHAAVGAS